MSSDWTSQMLLDPITVDAPCGENLEDTQLLASFDAYRIFGQSVPLDPVPDWGEVKRRSLEALNRSKDLRLLAHFGSAVLRTDGLPAFTETLVVASQWLENYWAQTHPQVTEDVILRRNALNCFSDQMGIIDGLRRVPLVSSRQHGNVSLRDLDIAAGLVAPKDSDPRPTEDQIRAAFAGVPIEQVTALHDGAANAMAALKSIDTKMRDAAGSDASPNLEPLTAQLARMVKAVAPHVRGQAAASGEVRDGSGPAAGPGAPGTIQSRQDAIAALDAVADFFRRTEPSSPVPMFLARAKRLVAKDFLEVLADIAPDAVAQARQVGGVRDGE